MNNRYLYRAKRTGNGAWIIGFYHWTNWRNPQTKEIVEVTHSILPIDYQDSYHVDPSTICQCTGMPDKNSKVAYEHDIIKTPVGNAKIIWSCSSSPTNHLINVGFKVVFLDATANDNYRNDLGYWIGKSEVIGNIFDNPELLEVGE